MGHIRLGKIPTSRKWNEVVALVTSEGTGGGVGQHPAADGIERIASKTLDAARTGLESAIDDAGLRYTFYLLTQLVLAAREHDWLDLLKPFGIHLSPDATLFDLTVEIQSSIDDYISRTGRPTDVSEMAQQAAGEAITTLAGPKATTLFGDKDDLRLAIHQLSTKSGFATLGQIFFGRFMARFLNFYLSRIAASQTGHARLQQLGDLTAFNDALKRHCHQSAAIVHDFCGEWYSKTEFTRGINLDNTSAFMAVAVKKLQAELDRQGQAS